LYSSKAGRGLSYTGFLTESRQNNKTCLKWKGPKLFPKLNAELHVITVKPVVIRLQVGGNFTQYYTSLREEII